MTIEQLYQIYLQNPSVSTDTRSLQKGDLFFALKGDNFNGNLYAAQALQNGASWAIIDEVQFLTDNCILVDNVLETLQKLATHHRRQLSAKVFGLTGSNGKTTTKELIREVLATSFRTHATKGNLNNHIGVPLTILSAPTNTECLVVEMGANQPNDIAQLADIAQPDYGVVTNIGFAHLEGLGGLEGVLKTKTALYRFLAANGGTVLISTESEKLMSVADQYPKVLFYGKKADFSFAELLEATPFLVYKDQENNIVETQLTGKYNFDNIQTALCVAKIFGVPLQKANQAIANYVPTNNRSQILKAKNTLLLDAYNANPSSMEAAIKNFALVESPKKIMILGDMFELGDFAAEKHLQIIQLAQSLSDTETIFCGKNFYEASIEFSPNKKTLFFEKKSDLSQWLEAQNWSEKTILLKASRGMGLETLVPILSE